jgi:WD40 repeat protein
VVAVPKSPPSDAIEAPSRENEIFVSYSRDDIAFVRRLDAALREHGKDAYVDWEIHPWSPDWQEELYNAIRSADTFVYVISKASVDSENAALELTHAVEQGKRIKPLQIEDVDDARVPAALKRPQWTDFRDPDRFDEAFAELLGVLNTDVQWVQMHTRLVVGANEWDAAGRDKSFLLGRTALQNAERWLLEQAGKEPPPTDLQTAYIGASRQAAAGRRRRNFGLVLVALGVAVALALVATWQYFEAVDQQKRAEREARVARSRELAAVAASKLSLDPELGLRLAAEAAKLADTDQAEEALERALLLSPVRRAFRPSAGAVQSAAFSPDDRFVLTADSKAARLWNVATGRLAKTFEGSGSKVNSAAFDSTGRFVALALSKGGIQVWSVENPHVVRRIAGDEYENKEVRFGVGRSGDVLSSAGLTGTTHLFDPVSGKELAAFPVDRANAESADVSPDGARVVASYVDGPTRIWDVASRRQVAALPSDGAWTAAYSRDGRRIVTADDDAARIWDARTGKRLKTLTGNLSIGIVSAAFGPDGSRVVTGGRNGAVRIWDASTGRLERTLMGHTGEVNSVAYSRDGRLVVAASKDGTARVWEVERGTQLPRIGTRRGRLATFSWDGRFALTYDGDGRVSSWEVGPTTKRRRLPVPPTTSVRLSRNGELLGVATPSGFEVWRMGAWKRIGRLPADVLRADSSTFSADNRFYVAGSRKGDAAVWEIATGKPARRIACEEGGVWSVDFSPAGSLVVVCLDDAVVWDARSPKPDRWTVVKHIKRTTDPYYQARFTPDSKFLILVRTNNTDTVRRTSDWAEVSTLSLPPAGGFTWNSEDDIYVTTHDRGPPSAWHLPTGRRLPMFEGVRGTAVDVAFAPSGKTVFVAFADGMVRRYDCDACGSTAALIRRAEGRSRPLTPEERRTYLHER